VLARDAGDIPKELTLCPLWERVGERGLEVETE